MAEPTLPEPTSVDRVRARYFTAAGGHPPTDEQRAAVAHIADLVVSLALTIENLTPRCRNQSLAAHCARRRADAREPRNLRDRPVGLNNGPSGSRDRSPTVGHLPSKQETAGSNPVDRSRRSATAVRSPGDIWRADVRARGRSSRRP